MIKHKTSQIAVDRVKNKLPAPTTCHYCDGKVTLTNNKAIYGKSYGKWPYIYLCQSCGASVGVHPFTEIPLGTLADKNTKHARQKSKSVFKIIYESKLASRGQAYKLLADKLGISVDECHFGWFDKQICDKALTASLKILEELKHDG